MLISSACTASQTRARPAHPVQTQAGWPARVPEAGYRAFAPHIARQQTDSSCSAAAFSVVLNALRAERDLPPVSELQVRQSDTTGRWFDATAQGGPGVDLDALGYFVLQAGAKLRGPGAPTMTADVVHVPLASAPQHELVASQRALAYALAQASAAPLRSIVLLNALQSRLFAGGANIGHFVVAAGYDEGRERVLLIDIDDVDGLPPFWLPLKQALSAMQATDDKTGEPRGYLWLHAES